MEKIRTGYLISAVILIVLGYFLPRIEIGYPWCLYNGIIGAGFVLMGIALKNKLIELSVQKELVLLGTFIGCCAIYCLTIYFVKDNLQIMLMCNSSYGNPVFALILLFSGSLIYILISITLKRLSDEWITDFKLTAITYIGQHTLGIFILHKPVMQQVFIPLLQKISGLWFPESAIRFVSACLALVFSLWLCKLVEYYIPELVGIAKKEVILGPAKDEQQMKQMK